MSNRPAARKSTLGTTHPAAPAPPSTPLRTPKSATAKTETQRMTFYLDADTAAQARAAFRHLPTATHGYRSLSELVADSVARRVAELQAEHNNGNPWPPAAPGDVPRGRPLD